MKGRVWNIYIQILDTEYFVSILVTTAWIVHMPLVAEANRRAVEKWYEYVPMGTSWLWCLPATLAAGLVLCFVRRTVTSNVAYWVCRSYRGTIEVLNPNIESGGGPFARGRAPASAMGVWRTPKDEEYANPEGLVGRKVRVYFDGDCTFFEAQVRVPCNRAMVSFCGYRRWRRVRLLTCSSTIDGRATERVRGTHGFWL